MPVRIRVTADAWECLEILRRLFFTGLITVILPAGSARQLFTALIVAITWLLVLMLAPIPRAINQLLIGY